MGIFIDFDFLSGFAALCEYCFFLWVDNKQFEGPCGIRIAIIQQEKRIFDK